MKEKVLVGLSGGVDSAGAAKLLLEAGYEVVGVHYVFCRGASLEKAKAVAERLGIPLISENHERMFARRVIRPFGEAWKQGITPNPCVECNRNMKFYCLLKTADRLGIRLVATGHYARMERDGSGRHFLRRAVDEQKDQSYFLWKLTPLQRERILFPLGDYTKAEVRRLAEGLVEKKEKESMEICFVPDGDTAAFLEAEGYGLPAGEIVDREGKLLGHHGGLHRYTVGQRRGLGVAMGTRYFVTKLDPKNGRVVLGPEEDLMVDRFFVSHLRFHSHTRRTCPTEGLSVKGRNRGNGVPCRVLFEDGGATVIPSQPVRRLACGQSACFYQGDLLLFGGVITEKKQKNHMCNM